MKRTVEIKSLEELIEIMNKLTEEEIKQMLILLKGYSAGVKAAS